MSLKGSKKRKNFLRHKGPEKKHIEKQGIFAYFVIIFIIVYQKIFSPIIGQNCRFTPTCSNFSILALKKYGLVKGLILSSKRILRCHPRNKGGYDPVP